jgi:beta-lactam-binding protein with PASTA domain
VPLLDGKYEILTERTLASGVVLFTATDPNGESVRVEWFDLAPGDEAAFERYRRLLKALAREGLAAVADVVSRPGARYVAWRLPPDERAPARDAPLEARISDAGFDPARAVLHRDGRAVRLYDLPFRALSTPPPGDRAAPPEHRPARTLRARLAELRLGDGTLSWLLAAGLLVVALSATGAGLALRANDRLVRVPDVVGTSAESAAARLKGLGLRVEPVAVASSPSPSDAASSPQPGDVASSPQPGDVVALEPAAGSSLRPGRAVRLTYAVSPGHLAPATVPSVVGVADLSAATLRLDRAGLRLGSVRRVHAQAPAETILAQSVPSGTTLGQGEGVDLLVSLGPRPPTTFLPDLVGLNVEDAVYLSRVAGLGDDQIVIERVERERAVAGEVLVQSLAPFVQVARSSAVLRLLVAAPPPAEAAPSGLPSLAGFPLERARSLANGFDVRVETIEDASLPNGVVMQSLPPGSSPSAGPLVLTVNVRPVRVPLPEVRVEVRESEPRLVPFAWQIESGITERTAEVHARTARGDDVLVLRRTVRGGESVTGTFATSVPGPVRFTLTLDGHVYGIELVGN